jgi:type VI secretion system protein ImpK
MAAETSTATQAQPAAARWKPWLRVGAAAVALLVLSQALWLWQSWPVRELLQPAASAGKGAR